MPDIYGDIPKDILYNVIMVIESNEGSADATEVQARIDKAIKEAVEAERLYSTQFLKAQ